MSGLDHPSSPRPRRPAARPASAAVAVIAVLLAVEVALIGAVLSVRREQDLSVRRLETVRAFYAAEAGLNMAMAELRSGVDRDGDGVVGAVSDDGDDSTDPDLGSARVVVTLDSSGPSILVRSEGRSGAARRTIAASAE